MKIKMYGRDITGQFKRKNLWDRFVDNCKPVWYWTKIAMGFISVGAVMGGFAAGFLTGTTVDYARASSSIQVIVDLMPEKIEVLKNEVIEDLAKCESGGKKEEDGIVILDSNNKGSYGVVQWQKTSYMHYHKLMTGQEISGKDAIINALDSEKAKTLAKWVVFESKNGVAKDWVNCSKWHGLQDRVDLIKKLSN